MEAVYQLRAIFDSPFGTGREQRSTTTVFASEEIAKSRIPKFDAAIRDQMKMHPSDPIDITLVRLEVIHA